MGTWLRSFRITSSIGAMLGFSAFFLGAFFAVAIPFANAANWYNGSWSYRQKITINHSMVASSTSVALANFPVLVSTTTSVLKYTGSGGHVGKSNGDDILFTSSDGTTKLAHEIETYASSTGQLVSWVSVPTVSTSTDTVLYMYYGNASASAQASATTTWSDGGSNYNRGIYHLANPASPADSSANANSGVNHGATAVTGQIGGGAAFDGSTQYIDLGSPVSTPSTFPLGSSARTVSAWVKKTGTGISTIAMWGTTAGNSMNLFYINNTSVNIAFYSNDYNGVGTATLNVWEHWVMTFDGAHTLRVYKNGVQTYVNTSVSAPNTISGSTNYIGLYFAPNWYFSGSLDEINISATTRSADWVKTEYNNQSSPSTFESYAAEDANTSPSGLIATPGNTQMSLSWTAPSGLVTDYVIDYKPSATSTWTTFADGVSTNTNVAVTGLSNGTSYDFRVSAIIAGVQGDPSSVVTATPYTVPGAPLSATATASAGRASVSFTAPASNGGAAITSYTVTSSPGGFTAAASSSPILVTGLTNGTAYTFTVTATNAAGTGSASSPTASITPDASLNWYSSDWLYRSLITVDHTKVGNTLPGAILNFPVLLSTTSDAFKYSGSGGHVGKSNGGDILFTSSDGVTKIPHEIETYASTTGQLVAWFQAPTLSTSTDSTFYVYYGNASSTDQSNATGTWDSGYSAVYHMNTYNDSTSNGKNGSGSASTSFVSGEIGNALNNSGSASGMSVTTSALDSLDITSSNTPTLEFWYKSNTAISRTFEKPSAGGYGIEVYSGSINLITYTGANAQDATSALSDNNWHLLSVTYGGSGSNTKFYIDGTLHSTANYTSGWSSQGGPLYFLGDSSYPTTGKMDEVRISKNTVRSADWIKTEYNSESSPSTFLTLGSESSLTLASYPTGLSATPGNAQASLSWSAPSGNGFSIVDYIVDYKQTSTSTWTTFADGVSAATSATVTGLTNGTSYDFRVSAVNAAGQGAASVSATTIPFTIPDAPTIGAVSASSGQASVAFTAPASNGGAAITSYTVTSSPGGFTAAASSSPILVTGLTNGTAYTFTVTATNAAGTSSPSSASSSATPLGVPDAPTSVSAIAGNAQATVSFTAPASNGGAAITSYTVTSSPGGITATGTSSPIIVTGLTNGTAYTFTVTASNSVGTGSASAPSGSITPISVPDAPGSLSATRGDSQVSLSWSAPNARGATITDYVIDYKQTSTSTWTTFADGVSAATSATVTGLTNGTSYDFRVSAVNAAGQGAASATATATPFVVPGAPLSVSASPGNRSAVISFSPPLSDGGSPITSYTVTSSPGGFTAAASSSPIVVTGLTNGTSYTFTVAASNAGGTGSSSSASSPVTPATVPGAPTSVAAASGNAQITVSFTAPLSNGGSPITSYTVTSSPGGFTATASFSPIVVTGLTNGTAYTFTVVATNANGDSASSSPSNSSTPATVPDAPVLNTALPGSGQVSLSWSVPFAHGSPITDYVIDYKQTSTSTWTTFADGVSAATSATVTGLTNGTSYDFRVSAVNAAGQSSSGISVSATPRTVPDAPIVGTVTPANAQVSVSFSAPAFDGGSAITSYVVTSAPGAITAVGGASPITVTGLTNGTSYVFTVTASNAAGTSASSGSSASTTPYTVPDAPTSVSAIAGNAQATVSFTAPASNGGAAITSYTVTSSPGGITATGTSSPIIVTGLTNGTSYTFTVAASNSAGMGAWSSPSSPAMPATVPDIVTINFASPGDRLVNLSWNAPALHGSPITDYVIDYKLTSTSAWTTFADGVSTSTAVSVIGLTNGVSYDFRVSSVSAVGQADPSVPVTVVPYTVADAPTSVSAIAGNAQATVSFTAPASNGGAAITSYTVTSSPGGITATGTSSPIIVTGLTNGTSYTFTVAANNAGGTGSESDPSNSVTPITVANTPTSLFARVGNGQAVLSWTAPSYEGGATITDYVVEYKISTNSVWMIFPDGTAATPSATVTGLINGTSYDFRVSAVNAAGQGSPSASATAVPITVPGAPLSASATFGNSQAAISFSAPASDGGSAITSYSVVSDPENKTATGTSSPIVVTGLTNGTSYTFTVTATNAAGAGSASDPTNSITPATVADAPTSPVATPGNAQASVAFTAPASNGGAAITSYTVTSSPGGFTGTGSLSPITVSGLANGTPYTFTVAAINAAGTSTASLPSNAVTPITVPDAPTVGIATPGNAQASVAFTAPASNGGAAITSYTVTSSPGGFTGTGSSSPIIVSGLTNGTAYTFSVTATNAAGTGLASLASTSATPFTVPGIPTALAVVAGNAQVSLSWSSPSDTGGSPITDYVVEYKLSSDSSWSVFADGVSASTGAVVTGLTNGLPYDFQVLAVNAAGQGSPSAVSSAIPVTVPGTPLSASALEGNAQATVSFSAPLSDGGTAVTSYIVTSSPGGITATGTSSPIVVTGLTNGTSYTFTVTATNAAGAGSASDPTEAVIPATIPDAPTSPSAVAGNAQAVVSFSSPVSTGGNAISGYVVTANPGGLTATGSSSPIVVPGLTKGLSYTFTVAAINGVGTGSPSGASNSVTLSEEPGAPVNLAATVLGGSIQLSWSAPLSDGGSGITDYVVEYQLSSGGTWAVFADGTGSGTTATVTGLSDRTSYDFRVSAVNGIGKGAPSATVTATPGEPAQVAIQNFPDLTATTIGTAVRITNEGSTQYEYQYEWCVNGRADTACGGDGDIFSGSNAKLIQPGENFDTVLTSTVPNPGNYWFHIKVTYGSQSSEAYQSFAVVATYPDAPTAPIATSGAGRATVNFTVPASNGGSAITSYTVTSSPGGLTGTGSSSPITVTGLTNGTTYTFSVTATNSIGTSLPSVASAPVTPLSVPGIPGSLSAASGNGSVALSWSAPTNDGGSAITDYVVEYKLSSDSSWSVFADGVSTALSATVTGLTNGVSYDFRVSAVNSVGQSAVVSASGSASVPVEPPLPPSVPQSGRGGGELIANPVSVPAAVPTPVASPEPSAVISQPLPPQNTLLLQPSAGSSVKAQAHAAPQIEKKPNQVSAIPLQFPLVQPKQVEEAAANSGNQWVYTVLEVAGGAALGGFISAAWIILAIRRRNIRNGTFG